MGYLHIENLYRSQDILLFRECYALEKVHGSSAHVSWKKAGLSSDETVQHYALHFFAGGESHERFQKIFDQEKLTAAFSALGSGEVTVFGEVFGGKCQGMSATYGVELRFIAFDVKIGDRWLSVPDAEQVVSSLVLEFVPYVKCSTDLVTLDAERDKPSDVSVRCGIQGPKSREGVVLRPLIEVIKNNGDRVIAKHRLEKFSERATPQKIVDPAKLVVLEQAAAIAQEWVTPMRLSHVIDKVIPAGEVADTKHTPVLIGVMVEDVYREAKGEIVESKEAQRAIGKRTAQLLKERLQASLRGAS